MKDDIIVIGAGGHAKVVVWTLRELGVHIKAIYDDDPEKWGKDLAGHRILGPISGIDISRGGKAVLAIGDNRTRSIFAEHLAGFNWLTAIHPDAYVHSTVTIGKGTVVFAGAVIQPDVVIGDHVIINTNCTVDHDCVIADFAHIGPGTCCAGDVSVGKGAFLGIGAVAIPGKRVGNWSVAGAGAAITTNISDNVVVTGVPARAIKNNL